MQVGGEKYRHPQLEHFKGLWYSISGFKKCVHNGLDNYTLCGLPKTTHTHIECFYFALAHSCYPLCGR